MAKPIGVMGGTFDPIHFGHLVTAEAACEAYDLEEVIFVPAGRPPHKAAKYISDSQHRYFMTVLATIDNPRFTVSRVDLDRPGYSYTVDTLRHYMPVSGAEIFLSPGLMLCWRSVVAILVGFKAVPFIVATRPGYHSVFGSFARH